MNKKILIIGQALPAVEQKVPYDTTMLYTWLDEIGITKSQAQNIFLFDAVYNKFPGYNNDGKGHKVPSEEQMELYFNDSLKYKIEEADKIIVLGNTAANFLSTKTTSSHKEVLYMMHPSRMNYNRFTKDKDNLLKKLNEFVNL